MAQHIRLIVKRRKEIDLDKLATALLDAVDRMNKAERARQAAPDPSTGQDKEATP